MDDEAKDEDSKKYDPEVSQEIPREFDILYVER